MEVVAAAIIEQYPGHLHRCREAVVLAVCLVMFVLGLSCVTQVRVSSRDLALLDKRRLFSGAILLITVTPAKDD